MCFSSLSGCSSQHLITAKTRFLVKPRHFFFFFDQRSPGPAFLSLPALDHLPLEQQQQQKREQTFFPPSAHYPTSTLSSLLLRAVAISSAHLTCDGSAVTLSDTFSSFLGEKNAAETPHNNSKTASLNNRRDGSCKRGVAGSFWKPSPVCPCPRNQQLLHKSAGSGLRIHLYTHADVPQLPS